MSQPLDHIEALMSVVGVSPFVYRDVPMVTVSQLEEAGRIPATIEKLSRGLCKGELTGVGITALDYDKTVKMLYEDYQPEDFAVVSRAMAKNAAEFHMPLLTKVADVIQFLRSIFPRSSTATLEGQEQREPNAYDVYAFTAILDALNDPLTVFRGMSNASILNSQVAAVKQVYPTLSAAITDAVTEMPAELRAAKSSFHLDWNTEIGINKWLGNPPIDPDLAAMLRQCQAMSPMNQPAPPPKPPKATHAQSALSDADRAGMPVSAAVK